jgi:cell wall assembly regulator SMI1
MSTLTDALERILNWLRANYPEAASSLQPGLSYEDITAKVADLPFNLPQEVYELYIYSRFYKQVGRSQLNLL